MLVFNNMFSTPSNFRLVDSFGLCDILVEVAFEIQPNVIQYALHG